MSISHSARDGVTYVGMLCLYGMALGFGIFLGLHFLGIPNFQQPNYTYVNGTLTRVEPWTCQNGFIQQVCFSYDLKYGNTTISHELKYDFIGNLDAGDTVCVQLSNGNYFDFMVGDCK